MDCCPDFIPLSSTRLFFISRNFSVVNIPTNRVG